MAKIFPKKFVHDEAGSFLPEVIPSVARPLMSDAGISGHDGKAQTIDIFFRRDKDVRKSKAGTSTHRPWLIAMSDLIDIFSVESYG